MQTINDAGQHSTTLTTAAPAHTDYLNQTNNRVILQFHCSVAATVHLLERSALH